MNHKEFRNRVKAGVDIVKLKEQYIAERWKKHNLDNVQLEEARKKVDYSWLIESSLLDIAYYCFWKFGESFLWHGYDVLETPESNKQQFDELQSILHLQYEIDRNKENLKLETPYPVEKYDYIYDRDGNFIGKYSEKNESKLKELKMKYKKVELCLSN